MYCHAINCHKISLFQLGNMKQNMFKDSTGLLRTLLIIYDVRHGSKYAPVGITYIMRGLDFRTKSLIQQAIRTQSWSLYTQ